MWRLLLCLVLLPGGSLLAQRPKRLPVPAEAPLAEAKQSIAESYRAEYQKAKTTESQLLLVDQLLADALKTNDAVGKYALLLIARDIAVNAGDWEASIKAIVSLAQSYDVDAFALADEVRAKIDRADKPPRDPKAAFRLILDLADAAVTKDRYDIAEKLITSAQRLARLARDPLTTRQLAEYTIDLQKQSRKFQTMAPHLATLQKDPGDPEANLVVGKFRAFEQHRWEVGAPMMALGSDPELAKVARLELHQPDAASERIAIGEAWWDLAEARKSDEAILRRRAVDWYLRGYQGAEGLAKKKIEVRMNEVEKWHSKNATYGVSSVEGDWAKKFPPLPTLLNDVDRFHAHDGSELAFCVTGKQGYIVIDLKAAVPVSRLFIQNRNGNTAWRAKGMTVHLSNTPTGRGEQIWQAPDGADEWNVVLDRVYVGRYLILARTPNVGDNNAYFHLRKVKVFGPE